MDDYPFGATLEEMDVEAFFNVRDWLEQALRDAGASVVGKGVGRGHADLSVVIDGANFHVSIKPLPFSFGGKGAQ